MNTNDIKTTTDETTTKVTGNTKPVTFLKSRAFQLTLNQTELYNDIKEYLINLKLFRYIISCKEKAPTTGHEHIHIYIYLKSPTKLSIKKLKGAHIEICKGTPQQNIDYITKDGNILDEIGDRPKQGGKNYNYDDIMNTTEEDIMNNEELTTIEKKTVLNIKKDLEKTKGQDVDDFLNNDSKYDYLKVYYIYGKSGTGKTQKAKEIIKKYRDEHEGEKITIDKVKHVNNFWTGTHKHTTIGFYDEFRPSHMKASEFLNFIDYNKNIMNIKGGEMINEYKLIIITSILSPYNEIYTNMEREEKKQWIRRMEIINMDKDEEEEGEDINDFLDD